MRLLKKQIFIKTPKIVALKDYRFNENKYL